MLNAESRAGLRPGAAGELRPLVGGEHGGNAEPGHPALDKRLHAARRRDVLDGYRLWPARRPVHHGEDVAEAIDGLQGAHQVEVHVGKSAFRYRDALRLRMLMAMHFS